MCNEKKFNKNIYLIYGLLFALFVHRSKYRMYKRQKKSSAVACNILGRLGGGTPTSGFDLPEGDCHA